MSPPPTNIDGTDITGATIDGQDVQEITVDGQTVFSKGVSPGIIDSFEDQNMDEYSGPSLDRVSFATGPTPVPDGNIVMQFDSSGSSDKFGSLVGDGLPRYPTRPSTIRYNWYAQNQNAVIVFKIGDGDTTTNNNESIYSFRFDFNTATGPDMAKTDSSGSATKLANTTTNLGQNEWLEFEIVYGSDGVLEWRGFDSNGNQDFALAANDSSFTDGNIGLRFDGVSNTPNTMFNDNWRII